MTLGAECGARGRKPSRAVLTVPLERSGRRLRHPRFDRRRIRFRPVRERVHKFEIDRIRLDPESPAADLGDQAKVVEDVAARVAAARNRGSAVVLCHGAHAIKNGAGPILRALVEDGWISHVATNGAGSIHDWEFAFLGSSCEDVRHYASMGEFGTWDETARWPGIALHLGGLQGLGFGESVGKLIVEDGVDVPEIDGLREILLQAAAGRGGLERAAAAADLLALIERGDVESGHHQIEHPWKDISVQAACHLRRVPFTVHPGIGQDIVYTHPLTRGGPVGRASVADFLSYANSIEQLEGGVYISCGSSVMSPMIFEKSVSMARNVLHQRNERLDDFCIVVNDLQPVTWNWAEAEPPVEHPAYYVRFCKSFSRMGGDLLYVGADNRVFLHNLLAYLRA